MSIQNKTALKALFADASVPDGDDFSDLVDTVDRKLPYTIRYQLAWNTSSHVVSGVSPDDGLPSPISIPVGSAVFFKIKAIMVASDYSVSTWDIFAAAYNDGALTQSSGMRFIGTDGNVGSGTWPTESYLAENSLNLTLATGGGTLDFYFHDGGTTVDIPDGAAFSGVLEGVVVSDFYAVTNSSSSSSLSP